MKTEICLKKLSGLLPKSPGEKIHDSIAYAMTVNAELMQLGFVMSKELTEYVAALAPNRIADIMNDIQPVLRKMKGADVKYTPMYPNFPQQVIEASDAELFVNALLHYWALGQWKPDYEVLPRKFAFESHKFVEITFLTEDDFAGLFTKLLSSNDSLSKGDMKIVEWYLDNYKPLLYPQTIPFKETACVIAARNLKNGLAIDGVVRTATDVLRVATYLSDGDVSLADNTKFKSLPRSYRRILVNRLDQVISEEDIQRHRNKWGKLFHNLHVGEYSQKVRKIAAKVRSNKKLDTTAGQVQMFINNKQIGRACKLLTKRPGEFARRLDHLVRSTEHQFDVVEEFISCADKVSTRVLMQMKGHFNGRGAETGRIVFPKGSMQKALMLESHTTEIAADVISALQDGIDLVLANRFSELDDLGKVWVDPLLKGCPLPAQQRSASEGLHTVARGTRLPIPGDKNTLRMVIYWVGQDIDLSATLHDKDFNMIERISYTNLKSAKYQSHHSGDIVQAPSGAAEFIDITMDSALESGARYVAMNVLVFSGPTFNEHEKCYAGWMDRTHPKSNEIFDPKTIVGKVDLTSASKNAIPVVFDLETREAIWCDLVTRRNTKWSGPWDQDNWRSGNNVEANKATVENVLQAIASMSNKASLYDLFMLHAEARGELVETQEEAETVFSINDGTTPYDINDINADFLV